MAHYRGIDGVAREVTKRYRGVDAIAREVTKAYHGVDGVAREYFSSGKLIGDLAVGSSVFMDVDGVSTEFLVVHQGLPDATLYDSSCNGTWLLAKKIYTEKPIKNNGSTTNRYDTSDIHVYLNNEFMGLFDTEIQQIIKTIKIPYGYKSVSGTAVVGQGGNGLSTKIFLLSCTETGQTSSMVEYTEGVCLDYFIGLSKYDKIAYYGSTAKSWWMRTPKNSGRYYFHMINSNGSPDYTEPYNTAGVRPALVLPPETLVDENFNVIA